MEKPEVVDLSTLDPLLSEVEIRQPLRWYLAKVIIGEVRYLGCGGDRFEAVGNLLRYKALRERLTKGP